MTILNTGTRKRRKNKLTILTSDTMSILATSILIPTATGRPENTKIKSSKSIQTLYPTSIPFINCCSSSRHIFYLLSGNNYDLKILIVVKLSMKFWEHKHFYRNRLIARGRKYFSPTLRAQGCTTTWSITIYINALLSFLFSFWKLSCRIFYTVHKTFFSFQ